ncbi:MAG TPA: hypothetical protein VF472_25945 [Burkholderiaceae bacterium]
MTLKHRKLEERETDSIAAAIARRPDAALREEATNTDFRTVRQEIGAATLNTRRLPISSGLVFIWLFATLETIPFNWKRFLND